MNANYRTYLLTVRHDETRTQDYPVQAHSVWAARSQYLQIHPDARIVAIRPARNDAG